MSDVEKPTAKPIRVVVMGASRCGTLGVYTALKTLGYTPFHMYEVTFKNGDRELLKLADAIEAEQHRGVVPSIDLDDLLKGYDAFVEIGSFFPLTTLHRYLPDPDVKWILTERDPASWTRSIDETIGDVYRACSSADARVLGLFNPWLGLMSRWLEVVFKRWGGKRPGEPGLSTAMQSSFLEYNELIKAKVPAERLLTLKLEDGFAWDEICEFLGHPVPKEPYPRINDKAMFKTMTSGLIRDHKLTAVKRITALLTPIIGVAAYFYWSS